MIDQFTKAEFEKALHLPILTIRPDKGEYVYELRVDSQTSIKVRSSIPDTSDIAADTGENSIRMVLWDARNETFLGKTETYTMRTPGWDRRMQAKIDGLIALRQEAGDCEECGLPKHIFTVKKEGPNHGRTFAKCSQCNSGFQWLDEPHTPYFQQPDDNPVQEEPEPPFELVQEQPKSAPQVRDPNPEQRMVIEAPFTPLRVEAGPGSGKTFTIARRYKFMVEAGYKPEQIIAVTFNVKMAAELGDKIVEQVPAIAGTPAMQNICTIHALCFRLLKRFRPKYRSFEVPPEWKVKRFFEETMAVIWDAEARPCYEEVRDVIATASSRGLTAETATDFYYQILPEHYVENVAHLHLQFEEWKSKNQLIQYSDMLLLCELMLNEDQDVAYNARFECVIIDEAQDTNAQAMRILSKLVAHSNNITIVGDRDQLLYRFAGATPEANLGEGFERLYPEGQTFHLVTNYRSTRTIVQRALNVISHNYEPLGPYDSQHLKALKPKDGADEGADIFFQNAADPMDESKKVVDEIQTLVNNGADPGQIFVAARTRAQIGYIEFRMIKTEIPFANTTGMSFWSLKHVSDLLNYLRVIDNPDDATALKAIINIPSAAFRVPWRKHPDFGQYVNHRFLGNEFVQLCNGSFTNVRTVSMGNFKFTAGGSDLMYLVGMLKNAIDSGTIGDAVRTFVEECYRPYVLYESGGAENTLGEGAKLEDLQTIADIADTFTSLSEFLFYVDKMIDSAKAVEEGDWGGRVVLSTIHRLKGLERDYVFGIGVSEYNPYIPKNPPAGLLPHTFSLVKPPTLGKFDLYGQGRVEDERCLFYVLITRARKAVFLSSVDVYRKTRMKQSRFIDELGLF